MRHRLLAAVALLFLSGFAHAQKLGPVDWIFLVDTSQSMRGVGGTKNIFGDVKASLESFVREANDGDTVAIITFDRGVEPRAAMDVKNTAREDLYEVIRNLKAEGDRTHLGAAIARGLQRASSLPKDPERSHAVVLFTDGKEDVRGIKEPVRIETNIPRVGDSFVFFVSMGEHEPQLDAFAAATSRTRVLKAPTVEAIRGVAHDIRINIPKPEPTVVTISPATIAFGGIEAGESAGREITLTSNRKTRVSLTAAATDGLHVPSLRDIAVAPDAPAKITVQLTVAKNVAAGPRRIALSATHARPSTIAVDVIRPSPLVRALKIAIPLAVLLLAAFVVMKQQRKKNRLEGELEILRPSAPPGAAFVGLPRLQANEIALSSIVPLDALAGSDARLFVRRKGRKKKIWIAAQGGSLRINDVETPMGELYDADTIEIGDAKLRFNRVGDERPLEQEETL